MQYFIERDKKNIDGPYSGLQIEAKLNAGEISIHTQLRSVGAQGWITVGDYLEQKKNGPANEPAGPEPQAPPVAAPSDGLELDFESVSDPVIERQQLLALPNPQHMDPLVKAALDIDKKRRSTQTPESGIRRTSSGSLPQSIPAELPSGLSEKKLNGDGPQPVPSKGSRFSMAGIIWPTTLMVCIGLGLYFFSDNVIQVGPDYDEQSSVVILLHGAGAQADDLVSLGKSLRQKTDPKVTFLLPEGIRRYGSGAYGWINKRLRADSMDVFVAQVKEEREEAADYIEDIISDVHSDGVPLERIAVGGFSQGAVIAVDVLTSQGIGSKIGAGLIFSGGLFKEGDHVPDVKPTDDRSNMMLFVSYGLSDNVVKRDFSKNVVRSFRRGGHKVRFLEFDGGHTINEEAENGAIAMLKKWISAANPAE